MGTWSIDLRETLIGDLMKTSLKWLLNKEELLTVSFLKRMYESYLSNTFFDSPCFLIVVSNYYSVSISDGLEFLIIFLDD